MFGPTSLLRCVCELLYLHHALHWDPPPPPQTMPLGHHPMHLPNRRLLDAALLQHFSSRDGSYACGKKPFACHPLDAWYKGDRGVQLGNPRNRAVAPAVAKLADAHLHLWNASVPLWRTHKPDECTHWCSPSAYHLFLYLLNGVLRDSGLGNAVAVPDRPHAAEEAAAAAAAAAATT